MKKLIVMLTAAVMAVGVQAASWSWTSNSSVAITPGGDKALSGASIYLYFGYASSSDASAAKAELLASLRAGKEISGYTQTAKLDANGMLSANEFTGDEGKKYAFAVIIADDADGNSYMFQSANKNATAGAVGTANLMFDISSTTIKDIEATGSGAGWYQFAAKGTDDPVAPSVPEPTSGLLMLVGLGALALRRRV